MTQEVWEERKAQREKEYFDELMDVPIQFVLVIGVVVAILLIISLL